MVGLTARIDINQTLAREAARRHAAQLDDGSAAAASAGRTVAPANARPPGFDPLTVRYADTFGGIETATHRHVPGTAAAPKGIVELTNDADAIRAEIAALPPVLDGWAARFSGARELWLDLNDVKDDIEREALDVLEQHLEETENDEDGYLSVDDLEAIAADESSSEETRAAARFFLDEQGRLDKLDVAADPGGSPDGTISLGDIHARQFEINDDVANIDAPTGSDDYVLPDGTGNATDADAPGKDQALFDAQQDAVEEAIRTGEPVEFENSNGEIVEVSVERDTGGDRAGYTVTVGEAAFEVESEIAASDTIAGIADIIDWGSSLDAPEGIRQFPDSVVFEKEPNERLDDDGRVESRILASYSSDHRLTFFDGDRYHLDKELYYHELGHGIGRDLDDNSVSWTNDASPAGWPEIHASTVADGNVISGYYDANDRESFAESFAAYMNARDHGPEALDEFRVAFPEQAAYIDEYIFGITDAPA